MGILSTVFSLEDPWKQASEILAGQLRKVDVTSPEIYNNKSYQRDTSSFYIPMDYSVAEEQLYYENVWNRYNEIQEQDWHKGVYDMLECSANEFNNTEALYTLAHINLWGYYNYPHNKTSAYEYLNRFNEITRFENSTALFDLAVMHSTGLFGAIPVDTAKGLLYFQRSARLGDIRAKQVLAYRYYSGYSVPRNLDKALLLYREIAEEIKNMYTPEQWNIMFPYIESYIVRIPDFDDGLLGSGLSTIMPVVTRKKTTRPPYAGSIKPIGDFGYGEVVMEFRMNNGNQGSFLASDHEHEERLVELFYTALDLYKGTYTHGRDVEKAKDLLLKVYKNYNSKVGYMDNLQKFFFVKSLDLLAHMYVTGEGFGKTDIDAAEELFNRTDEILEGEDINRSSNEVDKGLISQFKENDIEKAIHYYEKARSIGNTNGVLHYQLAKIAKKYPKYKLDEPYVLMQQASSRQYIPAYYEFARMIETSDRRNFGVEDIARRYKMFVEANENILAPQLRQAFSELLDGDSEVGLYAYAQAAEQGYEAAQVSAAYLMYQLPFKFDDPPQTTDERKKLAISYYTRAFKQGNTDAAVVAGDIYFRMSNFTKAMSLYQSAALKFSPQALWNIGYMYEHGLGVEKDFHMAKRFYDQVLEYNQRLYFAVKMSVFKLQMKSWLKWLTGGKVDYLGSEKESSNSTTSIPFFDRLFQLLRNLSSATRSSDKKKNPHKVFKEGNDNSQGIMERFGLQGEDLWTMICVFIILALSMFFRTVGRRAQWNVRINGLDVGGNILQLDDEDADGANDGEGEGEGENQERRPRNNDFGFGGNFDVQIFAI
ncbi:ubiquitin ligase complex subunit HRD3 [Nakaseomyces bracarensis]|uniref:ubiquitin ligase complex subunit HRD3 n=1 Tax=Nakaseomyces bracarensis TaxID=273131 RepID=UPI0038727020